METLMSCELFFSARKIRNLDIFSKSDPFLKLFIQQNRQGGVQYLDRTETISNNINPDWKKSIRVNYYFQVRQTIRMQVYDDDGGNKSEIIGKAETTLAAIMGSSLQAIVLNIVDEKGKNSGQIMIRAEKCVNSAEGVKMKWKGSKIINMDSYFDFLGKSDPYLKFLKLRDDNTYVDVGRTQFLKDNQEPSWKPIQIPLSRLFTRNDSSLPFRVQCWDDQPELERHKFIGTVSLTLGDLKTLKQPLKINLVNPKIPSPGTLILQEISFVQTQNFMDFLRGGLQFNLSIAIDFTGSNGQPHHPASLHYLSHSPNQYQLLIQSIWSIIDKYDSDKSISAYGFGAKPNFPNFNYKQPHHCFPLTGDLNNFQIRGFQQFTKAYINTVRNVQFSGPTYFQPVINQAFKSAAMIKQTNTYRVLLILTDGQIHDMPQTISTIIKNADLPLSIIIIGVGEEDFSQMKRLDGECGALKDQYGRYCTRDIVQFVQFNKYKGNANLLCQEVLHQIPDQVCQYMRIIGRNPVSSPPGNIQSLFGKLNENSLKF